MGVAVLNPHDCLKDTSFSRQPLISPPKSKPVTRNPTRVARAQPNRRKRSPPRSANQSPPARSTAPATPQKGLAAGQIRILKRGEKEHSEPGPDLGTTGLLGPAPELVPNRIKLADPNSKVALFYAGSAFFTSPPPSSVPLPAFFTKKVAADDATSGLRKLLRLDL